MIAADRVRELSRTFRGREAVLRLAWHAAFPVVVSPELLHLLRLNFFSRGEDALPYHAEADILLSPLCMPAGDDLFEIDPGVRDLLLRDLFQRYGPERLRDLAVLLWRYGERRQPWAGRPKLERAQMLTAMGILDPPRARNWLEKAEREGGATGSEERAWFAAMSRELDRKLKIDRPAKPLRRIVILFAPEDAPFCEELENCLLPAKEAGAISTWSARDLAPGDAVHETILGRIDTADLIVVLLSPDLFASDLYWELVLRASARRDDGTAKVIPIVVRPCDWMGSPFNGVQVLPRSKTPIALLRNQFRAWRSIADEIQRVLDNFEHWAAPRQNGPKQTPFGAVAGAPQSSPRRVVLLHAPQDRALCRELELRLAPLASRGLCSIWSPDRTIPGENAAQTLLAGVDDSDMVLFLLSADFIASSGLIAPIQRAMDRFIDGTISVGSVVLRPCDWEHTQVADLWLLPRGGKPVTMWTHREEAWMDVVHGVYTALLASPEPSPQASSVPSRGVTRLSPQPSPRPSPKRLVILHAPDDEHLVQEFESHLSALITQGLVSVWSSRKMMAFEVAERTIPARIEDSDVILFLMSAALLASGALVTAMRQAEDRAKFEEVRVIPILLQPCDLQKSPFRDIQPLPSNRTPVTMWANRDEAWVDVVRGIRGVIDWMADDRAPTRASAAIEPSGDSQRHPRDDAAAVSAALWTLIQGETIVGQVLVTAGIKPGTTVEHWGLYATFRYLSSEFPSQSLSAVREGAATDAADFVESLPSDAMYYTAECMLRELDDEALLLSQVSLWNCLIGNDQLGPHQITIWQDGAIVGRARVESRSTPRRWLVHAVLFPSYRWVSREDQSHEIDMRPENSPITIEEMLHDAPSGAIEIVADCEAPIAVPR